MSARPAELPPWTQPLRRWQREAVERWALTHPAVSLATVCPGAGKTLYAAAIAYGALVDGLVDQIVIVVPSDHLRTQAALTFADVGVQLDPNFSNGAPSIARDLCGAVATYQQIGQDPEVFRELVVGSSRRPRRTLVVLDELHHAGEHESWGQGIRRAFSGATHILSLSGTPFRSDETPVAFVTYDSDGRVISDTIYGYREALRDDVVRPLVFYRQGGTIEWTDAATGSVERHTFDDVLNERASRQRLRAALRDSKWVTAVLERAHATLESLRRTDPEAAGLIVAVNEKHARWIANLMQKALGIYPVVVTYVDSSAGDKIRQFRNGRAPWLVAVRMVSEGVDIPRSRVMVYLTTILTQMFFLQMVGRVVRVRDGAVVPAFVFFPDDPSLREWALAIEQDVHSVRRIDPMLSAKLKNAGIPDLPLAALPESSAPAVDDAFTELADHVERGEIVGIVSAEVIESLPHRPSIRVVRVPAPLPPSLALRPGANATGSPVGFDRTETVLLADEKHALRAECNALAKSVSQRFQVEVKAVHGTLRRRDGGISLGQATAEQLRRRKRTMEKWIAEGFFPR
jgi:superfamily II DNA or RNA helicase